MKKTLIILTLTLTSSIATISTPSITTSFSHIEIEKKTGITTRKNCISSTIRLNREIRKARSIKIQKTRENRKIREDRFTVQKTRENREVCHLVGQNTFYLANLK